MLQRMKIRIDPEDKIFSHAIYTNAQYRFVLICMISVANLSEFRPVLSYLAFNPASFSP